MPRQLILKRFIPTFDRLESRLVLDGNVSVSLHKGVLSIMGDAAANQISIASDASGNVTVTSTDGTTTLNNGAGPLMFSGVTNGLSINMGDGDDVVDIMGVRAKKDVSINMGNGNNTLTIEGMYVKKNLSITSGSGDDSISLASVNVSKQLSINTGAGDDTVTLDPVAAGKNSSINTGAGDDVITISNSTFSEHAQLNAGAGDDRVILVDNVFGKEATADGGSGDDMLAMQGNQFGKHARIKNFEAVSTTVAPHANDDTATVAAGGMVTIDVSANDTTPIGNLDLGSIVIAQQPTNGTVVVNGDGTVTYTNTNTNATSDTFTYTIANDLGQVSNVATVSITITPEVTTAPTAGDDTATVNAGATSTINVAANDVAAAGTTLNLGSIVITTQPTNGTVTVNNDGTVTYTNTNVVAVSDSFQYTIANNLGQPSNVATVAITINPGAVTIPVANNDTATIASGATSTINVAANDTAATGTTLNLASITITTQPTNGTVTVNNNGTVSYTNTNLAATSDTFQYTIKNNLGQISNMATVTITIG
jgi:hypothetical protein